MDAHRMLLADELALAHALSDQDALLAEISFLTGTRDPAGLAALAGSPSPQEEMPMTHDSK
jgi:hypothetical protein